MVGSVGSIPATSMLSRQNGPASKENGVPLGEPLGNVSARSPHAGFVPVHYTRVTANTTNYATFGCGTPPCEQLVDHSGPVMHNPFDYLIFWLPTGYSFESSNDSSYEQLIIRYFSDICKTNALYPILHQYPDAIGRIGSCSLGGYWIDNSNYTGGRGSQSNPLTDADVQNEVTNAMTQNSWGSNNGNNLFLVYTGYNVYSCASFGCSFSKYCAYHDFFWSGTYVIYANMPDAGTSNGCQAPTSPNNDASADSEINVSSHEQFEAFTDPTLGSWFSNSGNEIGDECIGIFGSDRATLVVGADSYLVQDEWSNDLGACTLFECGSNGLPNLAADVLGCNGIGPTSIGLKWGTSGYGIFFNRYEIQEAVSSSNSHWVTLAAMTNISATTYYVSNLSPNTTYLWRILDYSCCLASASSETLQVTQPNHAVLASAQVSSTSYKLSWINNANYTGPVGFNSYELMESADQNAFTVDANLTNVSSTTFEINATVASVGYSFYLVTTDQCDGCSTQGLTSSNSNVVGVNGSPEFVGGLFGEYWNASFYGSPLTGCSSYSSPITPSVNPTKTTTDPQVNFGTSTAWNWFPFGPGHEFSVKWIGGIQVPKNGSYSFELSSDDGSWLYIDSALVLNHGGQHSSTDSPGATSLTLTMGLHQIEVDYYETCNPPAGIVLSWTPPGAGGSMLVPSNVLVAPPRIDAQGAYAGSCGRATFIKGCQLLSTSVANDVVLLTVNCESDCNGVTPSIGDSSGLVFSQRTSYCFGNVTNACIWEYYAIASVTLINDNITAIPSRPVSWRILTIAISGANTNSIFDPSLPSGQHCPYLNGSPGACTLNFTTSPARTLAPFELLLTTTAINDAGPCSSPVSQGWNSPVFFDGRQETDYQLAPSNQSNYSFTCSANGDAMLILADGIQGQGPDFKILATPSVEMDAGAVANSKIAFQSSYGFVGQVSLSVSSPQSLTCTLAPARVSLRSASSSTLSCAGSLGFYNATVTASSGSRSHTTTVGFQVVDFSVAASPTSLTIPFGSNSTSAITLVGLGGYSNNVTLTASITNVTLTSALGGVGGGRPLEMAPLTCDPTASFSLSMVYVTSNGTSTSTLVVVAPTCVATGTYILLVDASEGSLVHVIHFTITVTDPNTNQAAPSAVSNGPIAASVLQGGNFIQLMSASTALASALVALFGLLVCAGIICRKDDTGFCKLRHSPVGLTQRPLIYDYTRDLAIAALMRR